MDVKVCGVTHQEVIYTFTYRNICGMGKNVSCNSGQLTSHGKVIAWWRANSIVVIEDTPTDRVSTKRHKRMLCSMAAMRSIPIIYQLPR